MWSSSMWPLIKVNKWGIHVPSSIREYLKNYKGYLKERKLFMSPAFIAATVVVLPSPVIKSPIDGKVYIIDEPYIKWLNNLDTTLIKSVADLLEFKKVADEMVAYVRDNHIETALISRISNSLGEYYINNIPSSYSPTDFQFVGIVMHSNDLCSLAGRGLPKDNFVGMMGETVEAALKYKDVIIGDYEYKYDDVIAKYIRSTKKQEEEK